MIWHKCEPRSAEWQYLKVGVPSASDFDKVLTAGGKVSDQSKAYAYNLLAAQMLGRPLSVVDAAAEYQSQWMLRGQALEDSAIDAYEFQSGNQTSLGGWCLEDGRRYGCSPDRLVGEDGLLEMKCPAANTMIRYLLSPGQLAKEKFVQVQGELLVTGRAWNDLVAYHPELPIVIERQQRDEKYIDLLRNTLEAFADALVKARMVLEAKYGPFPAVQIPMPEPAPAAGDDPLGVTDDDVAAIWAARER